MYKEAAISYKLSKRIANCIFYMIFFNKSLYVTCVYSVVRLDPMLVVNSTGEKVKKEETTYINGYRNYLGMLDFVQGLLKK